MVGSVERLHRLLPLKPQGDSVSVYKFKKERPGRGTTVVVFDGHGIQHKGMGKDIYGQFSYVRELHRRANSVLGYDLTEVMFYDTKNELMKTRYAHPAITLNNITIMEMIRREKAKTIGRLDAVTGESLGLFTAAYEAGVFGEVNISEGNYEGFDNVMRLVDARGRIFQEVYDKTPSGLILFRAPEHVLVRLEETFVNRKPPRQLFPAIYISKDMVVFGGHKKDVRAAHMHLNGFGGIRATVLETASGAFHTPFSSDAVAPFKDVLDAIEFRSPSIPVISNTYSPVRFLMTAAEVRQELVDLTTKPAYRRDIIDYLHGHGVRKIFEVGDRGLIARGLSQDPRFLVGGGITVAVAGGIATAAYLVRRRR